jgi:hypothetical protein
MINEREVIYKAEIMQGDINYFIKYKKNLSKYLVSELKTITKKKATSILKEIENINAHIKKLEIEKKNTLICLDNVYYGCNSKLD